MLLGADDGARLWVNGKEVFTTRETKAAAPEQHKVAVKLVKGKNTVLLKVANGNNPHGLLLQPDLGGGDEGRREEAEVWWRAAEQAMPVATQSLNSAVARVCRVHFADSCRHSLFGVLPWH